MQQANPPGAGLVTHRRTVQVSWREEVEHDPTPLSKSRTVGHLLPQFKVPIDVTAGWAVDTRLPGPNLTAG